VNEHQLLVAHRARETIHCLVHREERERIVKAVELGTEEELGLFGGHVAADQEKSADDLWK
jgi:hypothetical protein